MDRFEKQERKDVIAVARKNFNIIAKRYMEVMMHHKAWIEGIFNDLEEMVVELKEGE